MENRSIEAVHTITRELSTALRPEESLSLILEVAMKAVGAEAGSLMLHEPESRVLRFRHVVGDKASELLNTIIRDDEGIAGKVFKCSEAQVSNNLNTDLVHSTRLDAELNFTTHNMVTLPICFSGGKAIGVMQLLNKTSGDFNEDDLAILDIVASISAMSIQNSDLARQAEKSAVVHILGDLAHDIKNKIFPITMGVSTLEMLLEDIVKQIDNSKTLTDIKETLESIASSAVDVQTYTAFIADTVKGNPPKPKIEMQDISAAIHRQINALEPAARKYGVKLIANVTEGLTVPFDRFLIERAVYNLVNNALPETPEGGNVSVSAIDSEKNVVLEVRDTGRGMPPHILESITKGNAISTRPGGTGLGTTIVKQIAEAHGGRFEGESESGVGTVFRIVLPKTQ